MGSHRENIQKSKNNNYQRMKKNKKYLLIVIAVLTLFSSAYAWQNPMSVTGQREVGIGDPYILKFRGVYYLYGSSRDVEILCWKSKDLVNWSNAIICSTDPIARNAYAPEVVYWNGYFYMITSPQGNGHYVLRSESPTGPFAVVTTNQGKSIDGSFFIDDDGKWYFYHAGGSGIQGCAMENPTSFGVSVNLNAQMNNQWTEAPCLIKRNGIYYLIYTGNHVYSNGYRVDYGINTTRNPLNGYTPQKKQNPILINTEGNFYGLGHGTAFIGPDLDTYYFTYHNLVRLGGGTAPTRRFNYDRIAWNGDKLLLLGPTNWAQQNPEMANSDCFDDRTEIGVDWLMPNGGEWAIENKDFLKQNDKNAEYKAIFTSYSAPDFTAEFTIKQVTANGNNAKIGAVFSYQNEQNYGVALLDSSSNQLEINFLINNVWGTAQKYNLPTDFNHNVWHSIRIEKSVQNYKFFVDGLWKGTLTSSLDGGKIGYITSNCSGNFSYIALSDKVNGSGIYDVFKPVPGDIQAIHYNTGGEGVGYHDLTVENTGDANDQNVRNDNVDVSRNSNGGFHISSIQSGEWYKYNINVRATGVYNIGIRYLTMNASSQLKISQGETDLTGTITLPNTNSTWMTYTIKGINLNAGDQTLKLEAVQGDFELYDIQFRNGNNTSVTITDTFDDTFGKNWNYTDGSWSILSGQARIVGFGKRVLGNVGWTDYTIDYDVTYINGMNAGLIFRVNNPSRGGENDNAQLGTDFLQGYYVNIGVDRISLGKHNYSWESLAVCPGVFSLNKTYHVRVVAEGANFKIYVDDMTTPKIDYTDPAPFISGKVGFRSHNTTALFDNLTVAVSDDPNSSGVEVIKENQEAGFFCYPNPVKNMLSIKANEEVESVRIYSQTGCLMHSQEDSEPVHIGGLPAGMYIVNVKNKTNISNRKIIKE